MCEPTDDLGLSPEFLADEDIAREDDEYNRARRCTCGRDDYYEQREHCYDLPPWDGPTCAGCDPVDHECQPPGLYLWDHPAHEAAAAYCRRAWRGGPYRNLGVCHAERMARLAAATPEPWRRLCRAAERAWDRICCEAETHTEAVAAYRRYVRRVTARPLSWLGAVLPT